MRSGRTIAFGAGFLAGASALPAGILLLAAMGGLPPAIAAEVPGAQATARALALFGAVFETVQAEYVHPVGPDELVNDALDGMLSNLDPHSAYLTDSEFDDRTSEIEGHYAGVGLRVDSDGGPLRVVAPIDGSPAAQAGIRPGDVVLRIDGSSTDGLTLDDATARLKGRAGSSVALTLRRAGTAQPIHVTLRREVVHVPVVTSALYGHTGYIRLAEFNSEASGSVRAAWKALQARSHGHVTSLVLDLRNNPGGLLDQAVGLCNALMSSGEIVSTRARHPEDSQHWAASGTDITGGAPLVVLINGGTASASEIVAGALQDHHRAVLMGTRSFGKGSVQTLIPLDSGGGLVLTTALYYTPSGRSIQARGIVPDILVHEARDDADAQPDGEAALAHSFRGGDTGAPAGRRTILPPVAASVPSAPPGNWPVRDPARAGTDFQLQQALRVVADMGALTTAER